MRGLVSFCGIHCGKWMFAKCRDSDSAFPKWHWWVACPNSAQLGWKTQWLWFDTSKQHVHKYVHTFTKTPAHSKCLSSMATPWEGDERRGIGKKPGQSDTRIQHEVGEGEGISVKPYFPTHCCRSSQSTGCQKKSFRKTLFKKIFEILIIKVHISNDFKFLTTITFISSINYQVIPHIT